MISASSGEELLNPFIPEPFAYINRSVPGLPRHQISLLLKHLVWRDICAYLGHYILYIGIIVLSLIGLPHLLFLLQIDIIFNLDFLLVIDVQNVVQVIELFL